MGEEVTAMEFHIQFQKVQNPRKASLFFYVTSSYPRSQN